MLQHLEPNRQNSTTQTYQSQSIQPLRKPRSLQLQPQLFNLGILFRGSMSRVSTLRSGRRGWEIIMIVFGIELDGRICRHVEETR